MATFVKNMRKHIFLQPKDKQNINRAIKMTLLQDKKKYSDRLSGALLDVSSIKVLGDRHLVVEGCLSMEVLADFHIFCPRPGMELAGVINKCSKSHLGCLVMDTFNASLAVSSNSDLDPKEGDLCKFKVIETVVNGEIMFVRGVLISSEPGPDSIIQNKSKIFPDEGETKEDSEIEVKVEKEDNSYEVATKIVLSPAPKPCEDSEKNSKEGSEKKRKRKSSTSELKQINMKKEKSPKKHKS